MFTSHLLHRKQACTNTGKGYFRPCWRFISLSPSFFFPPCLELLRTAYGSIGRGERSASRYRRAALDRPGGAPFCVRHFEVELSFLFLFLFSLQLFRMWMAVRRICDWKLFCSSYRTKEKGEHSYHYRQIWFWHR